MLDEFIGNWGLYFGVFVGILSTGLGFPMPEELPIVAGGAMVTHNEVRWWIMLPVCIVGVIIGDSFLYLIGRFGGAWLVQSPFVRKNLLPPERFDSISANFQKYGVKILLFARLTPGIRAPIFLTAGITRLPLAHFLMADGIYAIPGVSLLFFLGYYFTDNIITLVQEADRVRPIIALVVLAVIAIYLMYRFWRRPMVTGNPTEMPPVVGPVTERLEGVAERVADKVLHRSHQDVPTPNPADNNGAVRQSADEKATKNPGGS